MSNMAHSQLNADEMISYQEVLTTMQRLQPLYPYLLDITVIDYSTYVTTQPHRFAIVYLLRHKELSHTITRKAFLPHNSVHTISALFLNANWLEREAFDQYGTRFKNHPNLKRVLNHDEFIGHPLCKDYPITQAQRCTKTADLLDELMPKLKSVPTFNIDTLSLGEHELTFLNIGPSHPASHGTIRTFTALQGEKVIKAVTEIGYLHRGFEKSCENHTYNQIIPYTDRLNYCSALANNIAFAKSVEEMLALEITPRAMRIRVILLELSRIMDHLVCLAALLVDMGALTNYWYLYNPRESIYTVLSKLTGARLTNSYMRIGGMRDDLYDGFESDILSVLKEVTQGVNRARLLVEKNRIFLDRTQDIGAVSAEQAITFGFTGPNLRACGVDYDLRKATPYYGYDAFEFDTIIGSVGDVYDRVMVRFEEIIQSHHIITQALSDLPSGTVNCDAPAVVLPPKEKVYTTIEGAMNQFKLIFEGVKVPTQEHYSCLEAPNGELGFYIVADGSGTPYKVKVKSPSFQAISAYPDIIEGHQLADAILILGSINIIAGEMDR